MGLKQKLEPATAHNLFSKFREIFASLFRFKICLYKEKHILIF